MIASGEGTQLTTVMRREKQPHGIRPDQPAGWSGLMPKRNVFRSGGGLAGQGVIRDAKQRLVTVFQWFPFDRKEAFDKVAVVFSRVVGAWQPNE